MYPLSSWEPKDAQHVPLFVRVIPEASLGAREFDANTDAGRATCWESHCCLPGAQR